ncbi:hypothetical protein C4F40_03415 [Sphingobacterium sp. Ka21]|uniref:Transposase n=1 Tax=Sphingobacterium pedocola TaxID=2082722 RepID=A0ABR9T352_9SPHI|nr:hypothetical protein [Sphingobacterium pedocola]
MHRNVTDEQLKEIKHDLYEEMIKREMDKDTRQGIYDFLARYVSFKNQETFIIFEKEVEIKLGRNTTMGTREYLLEKAKNQGLLQGIEKGIEKGAEAKSYGVVENLITELNLADDAIVRIAEVSLEFVKKVRADLAKGKK